MYTELLYFWCLPLCWCSPILIFWWNYPCHNVRAVSEVAGVWCLGPEGWRRDHQRLPPIHLKCSRGVKIWSLGGSAMFCKILIVTIYCSWLITCCKLHAYQFIFANLFQTVAKIYTKGRDMFVYGVSYVLLVCSMFSPVIILYRWLINDNSSSILCIRNMPPGMFLRLIFVVEN